MSQFQPGADSRRNLAGRPPSVASLRRRVRQILGRDIDALLAVIRGAAEAGDPDAQLSASLLLAAVMRGAEPKGEGLG